MNRMKKPASMRTETGFDSQTESGGKKKSNFQVFFFALVIGTYICHFEFIKKTTVPPKLACIDDRIVALTITYPTPPRTFSHLDPST